MKINSVVKLGVSVMLPLALGAIAGIVTAKAIPSWYSSLNQPTFNPPNAVFGPVWTTLYILLGISMFLVWKFPSYEGRNKALAIYFVQLALNFAWSFLFFYFKNLGLALVEIAVLWVSIVVMLRFFYKVRPLAAYLNIPYLCWVSFAAVLNGAYYVLN